MDMRNAQMALMKPKHCVVSLFSFDGTWELPLSPKTCTLVQKDSTRPSATKYCFVLASHINLPTLPHVKT